MDRAAAVLAGRHDFSTMFSSAWTNINDVIGSANYLFIMFYYNHCIANLL